MRSREITFWTTVNVRVEVTGTVTEGEPCTHHHPGYPDESEVRSAIVKPQRWTKHDMDMTYFIDDDTMTGLEQKLLDRALEDAEAAAEASAEGER